MRCESWINFKTDLDSSTGTDLDLEFLDYLDYLDLEYLDSSTGLPRCIAVVLLRYTFSESLCSTSGTDLDLEYLEYLEYLDYLE